MSWLDAQLSFEELSKGGPKKGGHIRGKLKRIVGKVFPKSTKVAPAVVKTVKNAPSKAEPPIIEDFEVEPLPEPKVDPKSESKSKVEPKRTRKITQWTTAKKIMPKPDPVVAAKPAPTAVPKPAAKPAVAAAKPAVAAAKPKFVPMNQRTHLSWGEANPVKPGNKMVPGDPKNFVSGEGVDRNKMNAAARSATFHGRLTTAQKAQFKKLVAEGKIGGESGIKSRWVDSLQRDENLRPGSISERTGSAWANLVKPGDRVKPTTTVNQADVTNLTTGLKKVAAVKQATPVSGLWASKPPGPTRKVSDVWNALSTDSKKEFRTSRIFKQAWAKAKKDLGIKPGARKPGQKWGTVSPAEYGKVAARALEMWRTRPNYKAKAKSKQVLRTVSRKPVAKTKGDTPFSSSAPKVAKPGASTQGWALGSKVQTINGIKHRAYTKGNETKYFPLKRATPKAFTPKAAPFSSSERPPAPKEGRTTPSLVRPTVITHNGKRAMKMPDGSILSMDGKRVLKKSIGESDLKKSMGVPFARANTKIPLNSPMSKYRNPSFRAQKQRESNYKVHPEPWMPPNAIFRRYANGQLDFDYARSKVIECLMRLKNGVHLNQVETATLAAIIPSMSNLMPKEMAGTLVRLAPEEVLKLQLLVGAKTNEMLNWNAGLGGGSVPMRSVTLS